MEEAEKAQGSPEQPPKGRAFSAQHVTSAALGRSVDHTRVCLPCLDGTMPCPTTWCWEGQGVYTQTLTLSPRVWGHLGYVLIMGSNSLGFLFENMSLSGYCQTCFWVNMARVSKCLE